MADIEVHIDLEGRTRPVGLARSNKVRGSETVVFEYGPEWLADPDRFSIEPALALTRGGFAPRTGQAIFGSIGDSAPDTWGRRLMQRAERRLAEHEGRAIRTLAESGSERHSPPTTAGCGAFAEGSASIRSTETATGSPSLPDDLISFSASPPIEPRRVARSSRSARPTGVR
jgi:hypothetical protein